MQLDFLRLLHYYVKYDRNDFSLRGCIDLYIKSNKRKLQAQKTKKHIFDVAHQMFREKGFNNVTIEEIADATGMSVGSLYHHFKNKYEILASWHEQLDNLYNKYFDKMNSLSKSENKRIITIIREMMLYMNETCVYYGAEYISVVYSYMLSNPEFAKIMTDRRRAYYKIMLKLMKEGKKRGEIRLDISDQQLVTDITIISRGCLTDWVIEGAHENIREHTASVLDCYLRGIAANMTESI
jgi:AcrR family transcriptional regulator